jgi:ornithine carbamoyltransferase
MPAEYLAEARRHAEKNGSQVEEIHDIEALPSKVDAVYTARWTTMGVPKPDPNWLDLFRPFAVTPQLMARVSKEGTIFMHDLPAVRGQDTMDEVLDGPQSVAFRQAFHKMTSAMAVLNWSING